MGDPDPTYLSNHGDACEEIGGLAWLLSEVVQLSDNAPGRTAGQLREELRRIANQARGRASVQRGREVVNGDG